MQKTQRGFLKVPGQLAVQARAQTPLANNKARVKPSVQPDAARLLDRKVYCFLGLPFDATDLHDACREIDQAVASGERLIVSTPNVNFLAECQRDQEMREAVVDSHLSIVDGMPITWGAKLLGLPLRRRVAGSDLFEYLTQRLARRPLKTYLFGGPDGAAAQAAANINHTSRSMHICGTQSPPFVPVEELSDAEYIDAVNATDADFLVLSLGAGKGLKWIQRNQHLLNAPVISHLGAVVNFAAGTVKRAPGWMRSTGFEWMWRILAEPKLMRRYFGDALALAKFALTRILPQALWLRRNTQRIEAARAPNISVSSALGTTRIEISGMVTEAHIEAFKDALKAAPLDQDVLLDLEGVDYIDGHALGLLMVRESLARQAGVELACVNANRSMQRMMRWNLVEYLLKA